MRIVLLACLFLALPPQAASADEDLRFRRTTPRATVRDAPGRTLLGVPAGRAWGLESVLRPVRRDERSIAIELAVDDTDVREAFVRVAWYERAEGRSRQLSIEDSRLIRVGERADLVVRLDPPDGAVAYRVRVLARVELGHAASDADAIALGRVRSRPAALPPAAATRLRVP